MWSAKDEAVGLLWQQEAPSCRSPHTWIPQACDGFRDGLRLPSSQDDVQCPHQDPASQASASDLGGS